MKIITISEEDFTKAYKDAVKSVVDDMVSHDISESLIMQAGLVASLITARLESNLFDKAEEEEQVELKFGDEQ